jgi:bisphosphoglycerate-dependent phosphoglycerate mutase
MTLKDLEKLGSETIKIWRRGLDTHWPEFNLAQLSSAETEARVNSNLPGADLVGLKRATD